MPLDAIQQAIRDSPEMVAYLETIRKAGHAAAVDACPVGKTGDLKESIKSEVTEDGTVVISAGVPYAIFVDRGHGTAAPQPFLSGAALDAGKKAARKLL